MCASPPQGCDDDDFIANSPLNVSSPPQIRDSILPRRADGPGKMLDRRYSGPSDSLAGTWNTTDVMVLLVCRSGYDPCILGVEMDTNSQGFCASSQNRPVRTRAPGSPPRRELRVPAHRTATKRTRTSFGQSFPVSRKVSDCRSYAIPFRIASPPSSCRSAADRSDVASITAPTVPFRL
jgi:hypothetical protein